MKINHKVLLLALLFNSFFFAQNKGEEANSKTYLVEIKSEFQKQWPNNRTINLVFHGHSVPSGYGKTPEVRTLDAYPSQVLEQLKAVYPYAVINVIVTAIGGENSASGEKRFEHEVLIYEPDVLFIDYALNDLALGLEKSYEAWSTMIKRAKRLGIPVILLTPTPDQRVDYSNNENDLKKHTEQIIQLAKEHHVGLADSYKAFEFLYADKEELSIYMAQVNHPNRKGHMLVADEIIKWFK